VISLAEHLKVCEAAVLTRFNRPMTAQENDLAIAQFEENERTLNPEKHATVATEKSKVEKETKLGQGLFSDKIIDPADKRVSKSVREFLPDGEVDPDAVALLLDRMSGQATDATGQPLYSPMKFPRGALPMAADGHPASVTGFPKPYERDDFAGIQPAVRMGNNYILNPIDPGIASPADFVAPEPASRPVGGPASDFDEDGNPIFGNDALDLDEDESDDDIAKRLIFKARRTNKSLFGNIIQQKGTEGNAGV
jgi:hypothetical protein